MEENPKINTQNIQSELYELYLNIKSSIINSNDNKDNSENNSEEIISSSDPILIIKIIKEYFNKNNNNNKIISQMENMIKKLEKDLRYHIKREFMLKIQKDICDSKIRNLMEMEEEYEELKEKVRYDGGKFLNNDRKDNEIKILRKENSNIKKDVKKMEIRIKNLEKKNFDGQEIIKELKLDIKKYNKKIEDMEQELNILKNKKILENNNTNNNTNNTEKNNFYLKINDKNSLAKININSIGNNKIGMRLKRDLTNYQWPLNQINYESVKSNNQNSSSVKTIDNSANRYIIHTFNKVNNNNINNINKNIIAPLRNLKLKDELKIKNKYGSTSMRADENKKLELIGKFIQNNNINKYNANTKIRNLSKISNNINNKYGLCNLPSSNSNVNIRHIKKEEKNIHEYSGLNRVAKEF